MRLVERTCARASLLVRVCALERMRVVARAAAPTQLTCACRKNPEMNITNIAIFRDAGDEYYDDDDVCAGANAVGVRVRVRVWVACARVSTSI